MRTALVVEDDESMLDFCATVLRLEGFKVHEAANAAQAAEELEKNRFDLILTDHVNAPSGHSIVRLAKSKDQSMPVIAMTGMPTIENVLKAFLDGADAHLTKPFHLKDLRRVIAQCLPKD